MRRERAEEERQAERDGEHERVRQIEIQKERDRLGEGGASAYRGSLWSSKQQQQQ